MEKLLVKLPLQHKHHAKLHEKWSKKISSEGHTAEVWFQYANWLYHQAGPGTIVDDEQYRTWLTDVYQIAIQEVTSNDSKPSYALARLMLDLAKIKSITSYADAEVILRKARQTHRRFAIVHIVSAQLAYNQSEIQKATKHLERAKAFKAEPDLLVHKALSNLMSGCTELMDPDDYDLPISPSAQTTENLSQSTFNMSDTFNSTLDRTLDRTDPTFSGVLSLGTLFSKKKPPIGHQRNITTPIAKVVQSSIPRSNLRAFNSTPDIKHATDANLHREDSRAKRSLLQNNTDTLPNSQISSGYETDSMPFSPLPERPIFTSDLMYASCKKPPSVSVVNKPPLRDITASVSKLATPLPAMCFSEQKQITSHSQPPKRVPVSCKKELNLNSVSNKKIPVGMMPMRVKVAENNVPEDDEDSDTDKQTSSPESNMKKSKPTVSTTHRTMSQPSQLPLSTKDIQKKVDVNAANVNSLLKSNEKKVYTNLPKRVPIKTTPSVSHSMQQTKNEPADQEQTPVTSQARLKPSNVVRKPSDQSDRCYPPSSLTKVGKENQFVSVNNINTSSSNKNKVRQDGTREKNNYDSKPASSNLHRSQENLENKEAPKKTPVNSNVPLLSTRSETPDLEMKTINNKKYLIMSLRGPGGSSLVYKGMDLQSKQDVAIKIVDLSKANEFTVESYKNEVKFLERLQYSNCAIKLYNYEFNKTTNTLSIVMEYASTDFSSIVNDVRKSRKLYELQYYWDCLLAAVKVIHTEGIVHADLKPANFVLVKQKLKLIDFGIAKSIQHDETSVELQTTMGTLNFISPEAISCQNLSGEKKAKIGTKSDVWSLGCILYLMVYGKTPFADEINQYTKIQALLNPEYPIAFPPTDVPCVVDVMKKCLTYDPKKRPTIDELLRHPFLSHSENSVKEVRPMIST